MVHHQLPPWGGNRCLQPLGDEYAAAAATCQQAARLQRQNGFAHGVARHPEHLRQLPLRRKARSGAPGTIRKLPLEGTLNIKDHTRSIVALLRRRAARERDNNWPNQFLRMIRLTMIGVTHRQGMSRYIATSAARVRSQKCRWRGR